MIQDLQSLVDKSNKIKQSYITRTGTPKTIKVFRTEIQLSSRVRFSSQYLCRVLRVLLRYNIHCSVYESDTDDIMYTSNIRLVLDSLREIDVLSILMPLVREFLTDDVQSSERREVLDVGYIEVTKDPLESYTKIYQPLNLMIEIQSYGVAEIEGQTSYLIGMTYESTPAVKRRIAIRNVFPSEFLLGTLDSLVQLYDTSLDIFKLPDNERIDFSGKTNAGFQMRGRFVSFGGAVCLVDVLPAAGWFVKVNRMIGKNPSVLLVQTSWALSKSQKAYVDRHLKAVGM